MMKKGVILLIALSAGTRALADDLCPAWARDPEVVKTFGVCPKKGESRLLHSGDSYPELAVIVSEPGEDPMAVFSGAPSPRFKLGKKNPTAEEKKNADLTHFTSRDYVADVVEQTLRRAGARPPLVFLPVTDETLNAIRFRVMLMEGTPGQKAQWLKSLVQLKDIPEKGKIPATLWQQDYFKAVIDEQGRPTLRYLEFYGRGTEKFVEPLFKKINETCPIIQVGADVEEPRKKVRRGDWQSPYYGGNDFGGPLGTCVYGSNQDPEFAKQYCPDLAKHIQVPTDWLMVGHVDEIVNIVPKPGGKAPCDFAIVLSSPAEAVKVLEAAPNEKFLEFYFGEGRAERGNPESPFLEGRMNSMQVRYICDALLEHPAEFPEGFRPLKNHEGGWRWIPEAWAGEDPVADAYQRRFESCLEMKNRDVLALLKKNEEFSLTQQLVQKQMDKTLEILKAKLPGCPLDVRHVPDLFFGGHLVQKNDPIDPAKPPIEQYELPKGELSSLLPNSANAEVIGKSVLAPHPQNKAFVEKLKATYNDLGLTPSFIDTFDAAHVGVGNLHCSMQAIRWCRPEGSR